MTDHVAMLLLIVAFGAHAGCCLDSLSCYSSRSALFSVCFLFVLFFVSFFFSGHLSFVLEAVSYAVQILSFRF